MILKTCFCSVGLCVQDWKPGSPCRAVYSEDGLVYPAVVLWVKGQRCRVRYDVYNNEDELDVGHLLRPDEPRGPISVAAAKVTTQSRSFMTLKFKLY